MRLQTQYSITGRCRAPGRVSITEAWHAPQCVLLTQTEVTRLTTETKESNIQSQRINNDSLSIPAKKWSNPSLLLWYTFTINPIFYFFVFQHNFCIKPYVLREPKGDPSNCIGSMNMGSRDMIFIQLCHQDSNSQPVWSQVCIDSTRPQWRTDD